MVKRNSIQAKTTAAKQNTPTSCIWPVAGAVVKNPPANAGAKGSIPGSRQSPGEGNGNPCQYSCLEIPWTEEPGRLQSGESKRAGHYLATKQQISG